MALFSAYSWKLFRPIFFYWWTNVCFVGPFWFLIILWLILVHYSNLSIEGVCIFLDIVISLFHQKNKIVTHRGQSNGRKVRPDVGASRVRRCLLIPTMMPPRPLELPDDGQHGADRSGDVVACCSPGATWIWRGSPEIGARILDVRRVPVRRQVRIHHGRGAPRPVARRGVEVVQKLGVLGRDGGREEAFVVVGRRPWMRRTSLEHALAEFWERRWCRLGQPDDWNEL